MDPTDEMAAAYDAEAAATGWYGPEVAFGLTYAHVRAGQSMLDIGIGTGLSSILFLKAGLTVHGMDIDPLMLDACRSKGFTSLHLHDLQSTPYPFDAQSMDHAVCTGVFHFFSDLSPVFQEARRILSKNGCFVFVAGEGAGDGGQTLEVGPEYTKSEKSITMYLHSPVQIKGLLDRYAFEPIKELPFKAFMDREKTRTMPVRSYLAVKR